MNDLLLVPAGAGAGKTHRIKTTLTDWVRSGTVRPERILAVTFTEAAASELRQRIRASLLDEGLVEAALAVDRAYVSTIHALGLRILTEHALANGSSPLPRLLSDDERDLLLRLELAHCEPLEQIGQELGRYGYQASFDGSATVEDQFRGQVFATINLLRNLGDRGRSDELAGLAAEAIRTSYGPAAGDGKALGNRLHDAIGALLATFPYGVADVAGSAAARSDFEDNHRSLRRASDRTLLDSRCYWSCQSAAAERRRCRSYHPIIASTCSSNPLIRKVMA